MNGTVGYAQKSPVYSFLPYIYWNIKSDYKSQIKNQVRICTCLSKVKLLIIYLQCIVMELHRKFYINLPSQIKKTWKTKRKQSGDRITDKLIRTIQPPPPLEMYILKTDYWRTTSAHNLKKISCFFLSFSLANVRHHKYPKPPHGKGNAR